MDAGARFALGTDVGAGTWLSVFKEGLAAYQMQRLWPDGVLLAPEHLLADYVVVRPPPGDTLDAVLRHASSPEQTLGAVFTMAREESVAEVRVAGETVLTRDP